MLPSFPQPGQKARKPASTHPSIRSSLPHMRQQEMTSLAQMDGGSLCLCWSFRNLMLKTKALCHDRVMLQQPGLVVRVFQLVLEPHEIFAPTA